MRVLHRYPTQKKLGLYNVPVSRVDETASKLAIAFKHDKGLIDGRYINFSHDRNLGTSMISIVKRKDDPEGRILYVKKS